MRSRRAVHVKRRLRVARVPTRLPNEVVSVGWADLADPKRPRHEVLVPGEGLDVRLAPGGAGLGVREVQGEVATDDRELVHGDSVNHQNHILVVDSLRPQGYGYHLLVDRW